MTENNYKEIPNYPGYLISPIGNIVSISNHIHTENIILKTEFKKDGYCRVTLCNNGACKRFYVHRLIALVFIPNPLNKKVVNHIDGNKLNNTVTNLEWCTYSENLRHSYKNNLHSQVGSKNNQAKLKESDIILIRLDDRPTKIIASQYNVGDKQIRRIKTGIDWKHV